MWIQPQRRVHCNTVSLLSTNFREVIVLSNLNDAWSGLILGNQLQWSTSHSWLTLQSSDLFWPFSSDMVMRWISSTPAKASVLQMYTTVAWHNPIQVWMWDGPDMSVPALSFLKVIYRDFTLPTMTRANWFGTKDDGCIREMKWNFCLLDRVKSTSFLIVVIITLLQSS